MLQAQTDSTQTDSNSVDCSVDPWIGQDKFLHAGLSSGMLIGMNQVKDMNQQSALLSVFTIGILKEAYDRKYGSGCFSFKDIITNTIGIAAGFLIISNTR